MITTFRTSIQGRCIQMPWDLGLPEDHIVEVTVKTCPVVESTEEPPPRWLERFTVDPSIAQGKLLIKGTRLQAEDLASLVEQGRSDEEIRNLHPELTAEDMDALRQYVKVPSGMRRAFGGWAEDAEELDKYLEWSRQQRKLDCQEIEE